MCCMVKCVAGHTVGPDELGGLDACYAVWSMDGGDGPAIEEHYMSGDTALVWSVPTLSAKFAV